MTSTFSNSDTPKISASMMCSQFTDIASYLEIFKKEKVEYLHIDVMDGVFAPNLCISPDFANTIRDLTDIPFDFHFMIQNPEAKLHWFDIKSGDQVAFHIESTENFRLAIDEIHKYKAKAFVALSQDSAIETILPALKHGVDGVLAMSVNVGFAGQKIQSHAFDKVKKLRDFLNQNNYQNIEIEVDGNMSCENAQKMRKNGASIFVAGTSSIFIEKPPAKKPADFHVERVNFAIKEFRKAIEP